MLAAAFACPPSFAMQRRAAPSACAKPSVECVRVRNARGEALSVALDAGPPDAPIALLVHGYRDSGNGRVPTALRDEFARRGARVRTARVDLSGNGESEGEFQFSNYRDECEVRSLDGRREESGSQAYDSF